MLVWSEHLTVIYVSVFNLFDVRTNPAHDKSKHKTLTNEDLTILMHSSNSPMHER